RSARTASSTARGSFAPPDSPEISRMNRSPRLLHETLVAAATQRPGHIAVVAEGEPRSYAELLTGAERVARALQDHGVRRGDAVAVYMENSWRAAVSIYGIS